MDTKFNKLGAETNPAVWKKRVVEFKEVSRNAVETKFNKLGAETNPAVWKKRVVEAKDAEDTYPADPRPVTVDVRFDCNPIPTTVLTMLEVSSVGSMKVLMKVCRPREVERSWEDET